MNYRVELSPRAKDDIRDYVRYVLDESQDMATATRLYDRINRAINSLDKFPRRCSRAPEDELTDYEVRMLIVGPYLVLFNVNDDDRLVKIVAARHGRQLPLTDL